VAVVDAEDALAALYRAYLATRSTGGRALTKGVLLDRVVEALRRRGEDVKRGSYVEDFLFDAVIPRKNGEPAVFEVLSFAAQRKDWTPLERDAGHFLFALEKASVGQATAVVQPPTEQESGAWSSYYRIDRWLEQAHVARKTLDELEDKQLAVM
jgi:hypothetical protein